MRIVEKYLPHYSYSDYCNWEGYWEIIEGIPFSKQTSFMPLHQMLCGAITSSLQKSLKLLNHKFYVYFQIDWLIKMNTVIQPDIIVVAKSIEKKYLDFSPFIVVEISSPSTNLKDRGLKFEIYQSQKVKYYLIIDPQFKKIEVYELINDKYEPVAVNPLSYNFIFEEDCSANTSFEDIWE